MPGCPQIRFPFDSIFANENSILAFIDHVHIITRMSPGSTDTIPILHLHRVSYWLWQIESAAGHRSGWRWNSNNNMEASFVLYKQSRITKHSRRFSAFSKKDRRGKKKGRHLRTEKMWPRANRDIIEPELRRNISSYRWLLSYSAPWAVKEHVKFMGQAFISICSSSSRYIVNSLFRT